MKPEGEWNLTMFNLSHNDIDYEHKTNKELSFQFDNKIQNQFILNSLLWLANKN